MERESLRYLKWGILFVFLNLHIGQLNLLPEFVGMLLFYISIRKHAQKRQAEDKLRPLLLLLAADGFLRWIGPFENAVEQLLMIVIYLYVLYVLFGEVAERIRPEEPDRAGLISRLRAWTVVLQAVLFVTAPLGYEALNVLLVFGVWGAGVALFVTVCRIRPGSM